MDTKDIIIDSKSTIIQTLKRMDEVRHKMLLVFDEGKFLSIVTIGELQRAIINDISTDTQISKIIDKESKVYSYENDSIASIKESILKMRAEFTPVLDTNGNLLKVYYWSDFFPTEDLVSSRDLIDLPVIIMAGGQGKRLQPLTNVFPKPLIPISDKTILEEINQSIYNRLLLNIL